MLVVVIGSRGNSDKVTAGSYKERKKGKQRASPKRPKPTRLHPSSHCLGFGRFRPRSCSRTLGLIVAMKYDSSVCEHVLPPSHTKEHAVNPHGPLLYTARALPAAAEGMSSTYQNIYLLNCCCYTYTRAQQPNPQLNNFLGPFLGKEVLRKGIGSPAGAPCFHTHTSPI